jgi:hypothetical protein
LLFPLIYTDFLHPEIHLSPKTCFPLSEAPLSIIKFLNIPKQEAFFCILVIFYKTYLADCRQIFVSDISGNPPMRNRAAFEKKTRRERRTSQP